MTIRPSSRSNGTGPAGVAPEPALSRSPRRPGAGSSALEQTGEGTAPTRRRRRRQIRPAETRLSARNRLRNPRAARRGGFFTGAEEPAGDPGDGVAAFFRVSGNPSEARRTERPPPADRNPTSTHHTSNTARRTSTEPIILRVCRAAKGLRAAGRDAPGERFASGRVGHLGYLGTPRRKRRPGYLGTRGFRAVEAVSRGPAKNAIIAQNDQKRPSKNRTTTTSAQMR